MKTLVWATLLWSLYVVCLTYAAPPPIPASMLLPATAAQVCAPGYAKSVRDVPEAVKRKVCKPKTDCIVDHVVSLELGGSNDISNLAAQTKADAHRKDAFENELHRAVCSERFPGGGPLDLDAAQHMIWLEWGHAEGKW